MGFTRTEVEGHFTTIHLISDYPKGIACRFDRDLETLSISGLR
jgi:hypothetical protein